MYSILLGIEHLMTGVQIKADDIVTFHRESASMVKLVSDKPFQAYWSVKQVFLDASEDKDVPDIRYTVGEVEFYAQVTAPAMVNADGGIYEGKLPTIPYPVIRAIRAKFGAHAREWLNKLQYDQLGKHWYFTYAGMYHGVEPDGYIHT